MGVFTAHTGFESQSLVHICASTDTMYTTVIMKVIASKIAHPDFVSFFVVLVSCGDMCCHNDHSLNISSSVVYKLYWIM